MEQDLLERIGTSVSHKNNVTPSVRKRINVNYSGTRGSKYGLDASLHEIACELANLLRSEIENMTTKERTDLLGKLLPYVCRNEVVSKETTIESLVNKYMEKTIKAGG